ncbi:MAG: ATP-binding protein [Deltaproteobacteria bacterium]|nr:ATP-binding protein [Deltaproteobacteria bacterium]
MNSLELARQALLTAARCALAVPADEVSVADQPWPDPEGLWLPLAAFMEAIGGTESFGRDGAVDPLQARLRGDLGLGRLDSWLVCLCLATEFFPDAAAAASLLAEEERVHLVTPVAFARIAHQALGTAYSEGLRCALEGGEARRLGLLDVVEALPGAPVTQRGLRIAVRELSGLLAAGTAESVASLATSLARSPGRVWVEREKPAPSSAFDESRVVGAAALLAERGIVCLRTDSRRAAQQLALDLASQRQEPALFLRAEEELPSAAELARLGEGLPVLDLIDRGHSAADQLGLLRALSALEPPCLVLVSTTAEVGRFASLSVPSLGYPEAVRVWQLSGQPTEVAERLARRFRLGLGEVRAVVREARDQRAASGASRGHAGSKGLTRAVLSQGARRMGKLVTHLTSDARLEELVLPTRQRRLLDDVIGWYEASSRVFGEMEMHPSSHLGRGLVCLFSGPPGTGKTFATQCLANRLGLNLYRIDLSQVVSKYIGETEKALATVFDEAEAGHGLLLFDEADALFGKRSSVKDAHDRYANIEVGYLLQRLESFSGVAILATNLRSNMDQAFVRRIRFLLDFPMPDRPMRQLLWEHALPGESYRCEQLEFEPLIERFRLSGGSIQNIGLAAAHLAATTPSGQVSTQHLVRATYRELEKTGQARSKGDFGPLADLLEEAV